MQAHSTLEVVAFTFVTNVTKDFPLPIDWRTMSHKSTTVGDLNVHLVLNLSRSAGI